LIANVGALIVVERTHVIAIKAVGTGVELFQQPGDVEKRSFS